MPFGGNEKLFSGRSVSASLGISSVFRPSSSLRSIRVKSICAPKPSRLHRQPMSLWLNLKLVLKLTLRLGLASRYAVWQKTTDVGCSNLDLYSPYINVCCIWCFDDGN